MLLLLKLTFLVSFSALLSAEQVTPPLKAIEMEWELVEKASGYEVRFTPVEPGEPITFPVTENRLEAKVPVGVYNVQVRSKARDLDYFSPWSGVIKVAVVAKELTPLRPENGTTLSGHGKKKMNLEFEWTPVEDVKEYTLRVWSRSRRDNPWVFTTAGTRKSLELPVGEIYFWQVYFRSDKGVAYKQEPEVFAVTILGSKLIIPEIPVPEKPEELHALVWLPSPEAERYKAKLSYQHLDETEWTPFKEAMVIIPELSVGKLKPGRYRLEIVAQARRRTDSDTGAMEFLVKPSAAEVSSALGN